MAVEPMVFKDNGMMRPDLSLSFYEGISKILYGRPIRVEAERGRPDNLYNTKVFTDENEEIWMSGFTCGKAHAGSLGLCELIAFIGWDRFIPREQIVRIVISNNKFRMEFHGEIRNKKRKIYYTGNGVDSDA